MSSADLRHVCWWNAADDDVLSSPSTAGPKNLEPYDWAWPPLLSDLVQTVSFFYLTPFLFSFSAPSHSNFQFHPQIELLSWHLWVFFDPTDVSACHFFFFPCDTGKGIVVWSSEATSTCYSSFSSSNDSASGWATATVFVLRDTIDLFLSAAWWLKFWHLPPTSF